MSVKKCSHCGKNLPEELNFCPYCMERTVEPVTVELPQEKKRINEKSIVIIIVPLILVLLLLIGTALFVHYKNTENSNTNAHNNGTSEDVNTTDDTSSTEDITENDISKESDILIPDSDKSTQGNPIDNKADKEENKTLNTNKDNTSSTSATSTTNNTVSECEHKWVAITETVHYDEVGHYETVENQRKVTKYKCPVCYEKFISLDEYYSHFDNTHKQSYDGDPVKALRNQYTTESGYEYYETKEWVVDQKAYDETVITGYKCTICEEEKSK